MEDNQELNQEKVEILSGYCECGHYADFHGDRDRSCSLCDCDCFDPSLDLLTDADLELNDLPLCFRE